MSSALPIALSGTWNNVTIFQSPTECSQGADCCIVAAGHKVIFLAKVLFRPDFLIESLWGPVKRWLRAHCARTMSVLWDNMIKRVPKSHRCHWSHSFYEYPHQLAVDGPPLTHNFCLVLDFRPGWTNTPGVRHTFATAFIVTPTGDAKIMHNSSCCCTV